jgi:hypothetical protein
MYHYVARALTGTLLFRTWAEGLKLFEMLHGAFPELLSICVMPDHVHLHLPHGEGLRRLRAVMSGYARWRQRARGRGGAHVWAQAPEPESVSAEKEGRNIRYVHLNPCRGHLVRDPLAWPLSSHRDALDFAAAPVVARHQRPEWFHHYVSADTTVSVDGTALPETCFGPVDVFAVRDAVSAITRTLVGAPLGPLGVRLFVRTASAHGVLEKMGPASLGAFLGVTRQYVTRLARGAPSRGHPIADRALAACVRVVGDPRFTGLHPGPLVSGAGWQRYRGRT